MLKLICSYSRKGPADEEFSSRQYHAGLEMELSDGLTPEQVNAKAHETFGYLKAAVEAELSGTAVTAANGNVGRTGPGNGRKITDAQEGFASDLARKAGLRAADLDRMIRDEYGVDSLHDLGAWQASALIETLKALQAA